jgi:hypothetical protein
VVPSALAGECDSAARVGFDGCAASAACTLKSNDAIGLEVGDKGVARVARAGKDNTTRAGYRCVVDMGVASGACALESDGTSKEVVADNSTASGACALESDGT